MKKTILLIIALSVLLAGCGRPLTNEKRVYPTYGIVNETSNKSSNVCYEVSLGNVVWSIVLIETLIAPIYFIGWSLYNPVRMKKSPIDQCAFDG